jgi:MFS family permease
MMMDTISGRKPKAILRWSILLFISLAMAGNYYIYDSISPLADLLTSQLKFSDSNIGLLMAIYSIPNILMVLIGGIIIDRIGSKKAALLFTSLILIGSIITVLKGSLLVMAAGRLIFGLGAESMIVAITTLVAQWFKGKEFSFAFGLNLTIARLGSFLALNSPSWAKELYAQGWQHPLYITIVAGAIAVICLAIYYLIDTWAKKNFDFQKETAQEKVVLKELFIFGKSFWFITLLCVTFYAAMFPFQTFAVKFFQDAHHTGRDAGGFLSSLLTLSAMIFTPLFGLLADKIGKRSLLMMLGSLLIIPVYFMMGYNVNSGAWFGLPDIIHINIGFLSISADIPSNIFIPMLVMGLAFSLVPAILWPSVAIVTDKARLGTAYGLMTMIQNIGLIGFNMLIGFSNDLNHAGEQNPSGYIPGMWIFSCCGILGLLFAFLLYRTEKGPYSHGLDRV